MELTCKFCGAEKKWSEFVIYHFTCGTELLSDGVKHEWKQSEQCKQAEKEGGGKHGKAD